jgi:hypothetical protein
LKPRQRLFHVFVLRANRAIANPELLEWKSMLSRAFLLKKNATLFCATWCA